jgi:hypothetical protein
LLLGVRAGLDIAGALAALVQAHQHLHSALHSRLYSHLLSSAPHKNTAERASTTVAENTHIQERKDDDIKFSMAACCGLFSSLVYCGLDWLWAKANALDSVLAVQNGFRASERLREDRRNLEWTWCGRMGVSAKRELG